ncbi:Verrucotoxin subunit beta [Dissostichus eleginoides]|uniref:Verrucotoxin subunit beta n=1 Tax=Dissostichus eleginoides TaxID=100907 RepID=A0AAD9EW88_DISEL|nr:Verrucotoxin subunit beta [Dissostichus eleginoides]
MDPQASRTIELAALGRPFSLGMLYDCRQDSLVPGLTLWDCDDLEKDTRERPKPSSDFEMVASESIEDKSSALEVEASLKASFLGGLVEVEGSAKYLNDSKTSKNQARVTLKYKTTTKFHELSMKHLGRGNVKHPYVFDQEIATHVVTGILYGAQAFFVFDREVSVNENHQDIQGNLKVMIKKIPCLSIEGEGSLKMEDKDKANVETFSCKFHGDFSLEKNPVSFQDAVEVYQSLPKLLGANGENAVPVKVWLLPLTCLDSTASKLVRQISIRLVQESQSVLEDLSDLEMRCNDALRTQTAQQFQQIGKKLKTFKQMCSEFKLKFQRTLAKKLPSIRGGGEEEAVLAEILRKTCSSPFNSKDLNEWMDCKEREISILKSYTNMMKNTQIVPRENDLHEKILKAEHAVCFVFTSLGSDEPYLSTLLNYLQQTPKTDDAQDPHPPDLEKEQWYLTNKVAGTLRNKAKLFSDFAEANKENKNITFLTVGLTNETQKGASIYLYTDGFSVNENFEPPSKPATVTGSDFNHNSVTLKISPPRFGAEDISSYSVEYCVSGEDGWKQETASKAEEVTVSGLSPNTEYMFRCRAETPVGAGPANEVSGSIKTLPCSPPGKLHVESTSREIYVSWEKPAELGQDVHVLSYIVEYAKQDQHVKEEDLHWEQMMARAEKAIISGLQPETEYAVRVRCDCGAAGRSKKSIAVNVGTTKREFARLAEFLKSKSKRINSESPSVYKLPLTEEDMDVDGCRGYTFGKESMRQNRTIMILGATGAGKSTLINGLINYIVGVEWEDDFRFKLVDEDQSRSQAESQTSEVTVYKINHQEGFKIPFSLTVVDTPGFGDTRGIGRDKEITEQIRRLFTSANGVSEIDAVCFVTQASLARLTATQRYVFDSVLSIFGKDVAENIQMLVTFADGKQPPVLEAINNSRVPCPKNELGLPVHFKFNNSAFFADNRSSNEQASDENSDEDDDDFDEMFWKMGIKSMEKFFNALAKLTTKSLLMTQEVLKERRHLEAAVEGLQPQVKAGLAKLEQIKTTKEKIKEHETAMTSNENFVIEVDVIKPVKKQLTKKGEYITNCQNCSITCHYPCMIADDSQKRGCASMDSSGRCTVCPGKCIWSVHFNQTYSWDYVQVKESQTLEELKVKYNKAAKEKMTVQELIESQEEEIDHLQEMIVSLMDQSSNSLTRLQEIALRPNPLTTPDYIDMLIEGEKAEAKVGYQARVRSLEEMREKATIISRVAKRQKLTKTEEELSREKQETQKKKGFLKKVANFFGY